MINSLDQKKLQPNMPDGSDISGKIMAFPDNLKLRLPKVSIIVTSYNYEKYVLSCIESIISQTYKNWHCVVVDDCSTDNSINLIRQCLEGHPETLKFKTIQTVKNGGQMEAIKAGLEFCDGEFVVSVDADDLLYPDFLETHLRVHLNSAIPFAFSCSNQIQINESDVVVAGNYSQHLVLDGNKNIYPSDLFGDWVWTAMGAAMFRKPVLDLIIPDETEAFRICADYFLFHFANVLGGSVIIPEFHGCYRRHTQNNFSSNRVVSGLVTPGNIRREPNQEIVRRAMIGQIHKRHSDFLNYYNDFEFACLLARILSKSSQYKSVVAEFPGLFSALKVPITQNMEQAREILNAFYNSIPGKCAFAILKFLWKIWTKLKNLFHLY